MIKTTFYHKNNNEKDEHLKKNHFESFWYQSWMIFYVEKHDCVAQAANYEIVVYSWFPVCFHQLKMKIVQPSVEVWTFNKHGKLNGAS